MVTTETRPRMTGEQVKAGLIDAARNLGYLVYSTPDSRKTDTGWPDILLCLPGRCVIAIECKSRGERLRPGRVTKRGRAMPGQAEWLAAIAETAGCRAYVVRPRPEDVRLGDGPWTETDYDMMLTILQEI